MPGLTRATTTSGAGMARRVRVVVHVVLAIVASWAVAPGAHAQPLDVKLMALTSPVSPWARATIAVQTATAAECHITVWYKSGPSRARGLGPKVADSHGRVSWTWVVGSNTTPGTWPIAVTCSAAGREGTLQTSFEVR